MWMANAHPLELRERVVAAYEAGEGGYICLARRFKVGEASVKRWVRQFRRDGDLGPKKKGGGTPSRIDMRRLELVVTTLGDATAGEITAAYNRGLRGDARHHVSRVKRALHRAGYVVKVRPLEQLRPDVVEMRNAFLERIRRVPVEQLVFLDESGLNLAMGRAYAWVKRGQELVFRKPMNRGKNLTLLGAIRASGWVLLSTMFKTTTKDRFVS